MNHEIMELAKFHLKTTLNNAALAREQQGLACGDTGFPLFYIALGAGILE